MKKDLETLLKKLDIQSESAEEILSLVEQYAEFETLAMDEATMSMVGQAPIDHVFDEVEYDNDTRYQDCGMLGKGGMGEVRNVLDRKLHRNVAMKILHSAWKDNSRERVRFTSEGQIAAQLEHPNIIPVYDLGKLPDGRPYFTMQIIRDRSFRTVVWDVHQGNDKKGRYIQRTGWSLNRMLNVFLKICDAIGYAHNRGIIHRDLKPSNIMLGEHGEVIVVDWGLAKIVEGVKKEDFGEPIVSNRNDENDKTQIGHVSGTPSYMSPEQAKGLHNEIGYASDIYSLGIILYEILSGAPPFRGRSPEETIFQIRTKEAPPLYKSKVEIGGCYRHPAGHLIPTTIVEACEKAISKASLCRFSTVEDFAQVIRDWLQGAKQREHALEIVDAAQQCAKKVEELEREAAVLQLDGEHMLQDIPSWEVEDIKRPAWDKLDQATQLKEQADLYRITQEQKLQSALTHKADLPEAHLALADFYRDQHQKAEESSNKKDSTILLEKLKHHVLALREDHPKRQNFEQYIAGDGILSLQTFPSGASIHLEQFVTLDRRLVAQSVGDIGVTPLEEYPIKMGSYRLRIQKSGYEEALVPVHISRQGSWNVDIPKGVIPHIHLQPKGRVSQEEVFIPKGWFWCGGDPELANSLDKKKVWVDSFVISKYPVTNVQYIEFLNHLMEHGKKSEAMLHVPRERAGTYGEEGSAIYGYDQDSGFYLRPDADGDVWGMEWPVMMINWVSACAYAAWRAEQDDLPWRLPYELEWEKAARGADSRIYPWGNYFDPAWCIMRSSHPSRPMPKSVYAQPLDESPYGVQGMGGNIRNWTLSSALSDYSQCVVMPKPKIHPELFDMKDPAKAGPQRVDRGGCWNGSYRYSRVAGRDFVFPWRKDDFLGFRIVRDVV